MMITLPEDGVAMCSCGRLEHELCNLSYLPAPGCVEGAMHHQKWGPCGRCRTLHAVSQAYIAQGRKCAVLSTAAGSEQTERQCTCDGGMCSISSSRPSRSLCLLASACLRTAFNDPLGRTGHSSLVRRTLTGEDCHRAVRQQHMLWSCNVSSCWVAVQRAGGLDVSIVGTACHA